MADSRELQLILEMKDKTSKEMKKVQKSVNEVDKTIKKVDWKKVAVGLTAIAGAVVFTGKKFVDLASAMEESENRFTTLFGESSKEVDKWSKNLSDAVGRNVTDIKDGLSAFKGMATGLGLIGEQGDEMAKKLQEASIDFASFNNLSDGEAQQRFISAMSGSSEVLNNYGINTKASAIETELLNMGINKSTAEATEAEKAMARYNIIMKTMGEQGAVGDAVKTAGSYANQAKRLQSNLKTLGEQIGSVLIPIVNKLVIAINTVMNIFKSFDMTAMRNNETLQTVITLFKDLANTFVEEVRPELEALWEELKPLMPFFTLLAKILATALLGALIVVTKALQTGLIVVIKILTTSLAIANKTVEIFKSIWDGVTNTIKSVVEWIQKLIDKIKSLNIVSSASNAIKGAFTAVSNTFGGARANGGRVTTGSSFLVGEKGPEMFTPNENGKIIPNNKLGAGGVTITNIINGDVSGRELIEKVSEGIMNNLRTEQRLAIQ